MLSSVIRSEREVRNGNEAWLVGFPIVAVLVLAIVVQSTLALFGKDSLTTGVCRQTGASEARFMAMMLH